MNYFTISDLCDQTIGRLLEGSMGQLTDEGYSQSQLGSDSYLASFDCSISQCSSIASSVSSLPEKLKDIEEALSSTPKKSKKEFVDVSLDD